MDAIGCFALTELGFGERRGVSCSGVVCSGGVFGAVVHSACFVMLTTWGALR
jgi:hypothetical protein